MKKYNRTSFVITLASFFFHCVYCSANEVVTIIADEITYDDERATLKAVGEVEVQYGDYKLLTPELTYNKDKNLLIAAKPIEIKNKDIFKVLASSAQINDEFKQIIALHASALIEKTFYVQSKKMERNKQGQSFFYSSVGTACEICPSSPVPMWQIKSERIVHDPKTKQLHFTNARMEFLGLPIFYTPYLRIPEPGIKRATGLLTPKLLTSNLLGVGIKQPFYINLDQTSDITLSILKTTKTKFLLESDYRKLFNQGSLFISGAAKPESENNILDGYFQVLGSAITFGGSKLSYDATAVSDRGFLGKYGYSDTDRLTSTIKLTKQMERSFSGISGTYFTSLRDNYQGEYSIAPNFFTRHFMHSKNFNTFSGIEISLVGLTNKNLENNLRLNTSVDVEKEWKTRQGFQIKSINKISSSLYRINFNDGRYNLYKYFDPTLGLELTFPFYRDLKQRMDIIKPTLQLVYSPDLTINDEVPNTDSQPVKLDQSSLFSLNRFSGLDQQEYGLRLNSGIEYSVDNNGPFSYDLALGQIFRTNTSTQFSEGSGLSGLKSDILISGNINYKSSLTVYGQQLYNQDLKLKQAETTLSFIQAEQTVTSGLIFFEADLNENRPSDLTELTLGIDSTLNRNWLTSFHLRRNINENENINASLQFTYENECSKINLSFKRRFTETNSLPADTSVELTFDLNGIGDKRNSLRKSNCLIYN